MHITRTMLLALSAALLQMPDATAADAKWSPNKQVEIVVPAGPGAASIEPDAPSKAFSRTKNISTRASS